MNEILDYGDERHRRRLLELADETVLVRVLPYLTGNQFSISSSGVALSAELYEALGVRQCEVFHGMRDDPEFLSDERLAIASLEIGMEAARMVIQTCRSAAADDISAQEKLGIALDLLENLKKIVPVFDRVEGRSAAVFRELQQRQSA